ncbi:MAG: beta-N-acetylhexosaminidase [Anaerolineae bacterium]|nr:beta-N-acetylhexosaminidase [Anaerolineae bacterium]
MRRRCLNPLVVAALVCSLGPVSTSCLRRPAPTAAPPVPVARVASASPAARPSPTPEPTATSTPTATPTPSPTPTPDPVEGLLAAMTLEDKVGQMLMLGLPGPTVDEQARHAVFDLRAGGVVLISRNAESPEQLAALLRDLQALAASHTPPVPLFVAIDHEGGAIVRLSRGVTFFPSNMALGAACADLEAPPPSWQLAYEVGRHGAQELAAMGVNMNLAPVLDVNTEPANPVIGLRSFGAWPARVSELGAAFIRGTREAGVIAVAKHFPGHGGVSVDSHYGLPVLEASAEDLWAVELAPFRSAIAAGVEVIMSAHLAVPALTGDRTPATLAPEIMTDLLRGRLRFNGVAMTDDLSMRGITGTLGQPEAAVKAVEAGCDVVLVVACGAVQDEVQAALIEAVRSGRLSGSRIDESIRRILSLKVRSGLFTPRGDSLSVVGSPEHLALARQVSARAITAVQARGPALAAQVRTLAVAPSYLPAGQEEGWTLFGEEVRRRSSTCREVLYDPYARASLEPLLAEVPQLAGEYDQVAIGLWDASLLRAWGGGDAPYRLVRAFSEAGVRVAVVAFHLPYDLAGLPPEVLALATYGVTRPQVEAAAAVLYGESEARGALPVPLAGGSP